MTMLAEVNVSGEDGLVQLRRKLHEAALCLGAGPEDAARSAARASDLLRSALAKGSGTRVRISLARTESAARLTIEFVCAVPPDAPAEQTAIATDGWHGFQYLQIPGDAPSEASIANAGAILRAKSREQLLEENNRLLRETMQARTETLNRLAHELGSIQDLDTMLLRVLLEARATFRCDGGSILLHESDRLRFRLASTGGAHRAEDALLHGGDMSYLPLDRTSLAGAAGCDGLVVVRDAYEIPAGAPYRFNPEYDRRTGFRTRGVLAISMRSSQGELLGVLQLLNPAGTSEGEHGAFSEDDVKLAIHFAGMASMAIERSAMTRALVLRMMRLAELRDPKETGAHVRRVAEVSCRLFVAWARQRGLEEREIVMRLDQLRPAAMLHDVGKVGIEDAILKKPGRLDPEERKLMERHSRIGATTLLGVRTAMDPAIRDVTLYHHTRWDGTGYPTHTEIVDTLRELGVDSSSAPEPRGEAIPLAARLVAIADVFDALMSRRAYKDAWDPEAVRAEFERSSGTHFDPELVRLFLSEFDDYVRLHAKIND
jgi:HD-GYP domain-containing protein (c-di-GMP phosphodiesterase class II)